MWIIAHNYFIFTKHRFPTEIWHVVSGTLSTSGIVFSQQGFTNWHVVATGVVPFVVFLIAATAELALGKTARRPLALVRGARPLHAEAGSIRDSLMPADWDLFR